MPYNDAAKNLMLDELGAAGNIDFISLHDGFPGLTGLNEVSGGSYARQSITWNAASAGNLDSSNAPIVPVPASTTVEWVGYWSLVTVGTFYAYSPLNANPFLFTVDITGDKILAPAHGLVDDDLVVFFNGTPPGGLTEGTVLYFVITATTDDFQVSLTSGGAAIVLTTQGDSDVRASIILPETFGAAGNLTISDADLGLNL